MDGDGSGPGSNDQKNQDPFANLEQFKKEPLARSMRSSVNNDANQSEEISFEADNMETIYEPVDFSVLPGFQKVEVLNEFEKEQVNGKPYGLRMRVAHCEVDGFKYVVADTFYSQTGGGKLNSFFDVSGQHIQTLKMDPSIDLFCILSDIRLTNMIARDGLSAKAEDFADTVTALVSGGLLNHPAFRFFIDIPAKRYNIDLMRVRTPQEAMDRLVHKINEAIETHQKSGNADKTQSDMWEL